MDLGEQMGTSARLTNTKHSEAQGHGHKDRSWIQSEFIDNRARI